MRFSNTNPDKPVITAAEFSAIAEIEATTSTLQLVSRLTQMRFVSIAKFTESDWIACAVHDAVHFGIAPGDAFALEESLCNAMRFDHKALVIPRLSQDPKYRDHPNVSLFGFESYVAIPIFFSNGTLFGSLCAIDSQPALLDDPDVISTLEIIAKLIGVIFSMRINQQEHAS
ncbi:GAF domain-containing protein [Pseudomonas savastanoi]|uniref:GAF domain-containing protein n=1 Tax=Pseudomonas savastanoi TaxID=29438 RepID=UPI000EFE45DA|nr:GAF domain-containing protein [Pseudomonas savastanoi]